MGLVGEAFSTSFCATYLNLPKRVDAMRESLIQMTIRSISTPWRVMTTRSTSTL